ncbi:MAG: hypothetical protein JRN68_02255 [Nitrososphaerota archaeon]|jgi:hypothetical protein|nr:hypothetical protein [Nitrososphaerota archaeon]
MNNDDSAEIASELASLLRYDQVVLLGFIRALTIEEEISVSTMSELLGVGEEVSSKIMEKMIEDGLMIRGKVGYIPLHPRLALSNLYRIALARDDAVRVGRVRLDAITAMLVKRREDVQGW